MKQKTGGKARDANVLPKPPSYKAVLQVNCPLCGADVLQLCLNLHAPDLSKKRVQDYLRGNLHAETLTSKTPHDARVRWYQHVQRVKQETLAAQKAPKPRRAPPRKASKASGRQPG
jgi:hypothetical protein